jgi:hypothetical protein
VPGSISKAVELGERAPTALQERKAEEMNPNVGAGSSERSTIWAVIWIAVLFDVIYTTSCLRQKYFSFASQS